MTTSFLHSTFCMFHSFFSYSKCLWGSTTLQIGADETTIAIVEEEIEGCISLPGCWRKGCQRVVTAIKATELFLVQQPPYHDNWVGTRRATQNRNHSLYQHSTWNHLQIQNWWGLLWSLWGVLIGDSVFYRDSVAKKDIINIHKWSAIG